MKKLLHIFALTDNHDNPIFKISISKEVQDEISKTFEKQEEEFTSNIESAISFNGNYKPEENELLYIENFLPSSNTENGEDIKNPNINIVNKMRNAIKNPTTICCENLTIKDMPLDSIRAIFSGYIFENKTIRILIQVFNNSHIITKKGWLALFLDKNVFTKIDPKNLLMLDNKLTAIIDGNKIKFKNFYYLRQIFDMTLFYREATNPELINFTKLPLMHFPDATAFIDSADTQIRRKIGLMFELNTFDILNKNSIPTIVSEAKKIGINLTTIKQQGKDIIEIPTGKKEIMLFLSFLEESIYKGQFTHTNYISNSKKKFQ
jgi:hypothetical protein